MRVWGGWHWLWFVPSDRHPPGAWIFVCCECRVLSGRGLCDEMITRPEESCRLCCVVVCDLETSRIGASYIYDISNLRVKSRINEDRGKIGFSILLFYFSRVKFFLKTIFSYILNQCSLIQIKKKIVHVRTFPSSVVIISNQTR